MNMGYGQSARSRWQNIGKLFFCQIRNRNETAQGPTIRRKEQRQYPAILVELASTIQDLLYGFTGLATGTWSLSSVYHSLHTTGLKNTRVNTKISDFPCPTIKNTEPYFTQAGKTSVLYFKMKRWKFIPVFRPNRLKNHTLWGGKYSMPSLYVRPPTTQKLVLD